LRQHISLIVELRRSQTGKLVENIAGFLVPNQLTLDLKHCQETTPLSDKNKDVEATQLQTSSFLSGF
jgi:hypothetical protein